MGATNNKKEALFTYFLSGLKAENITNTSDVLPGAYLKSDPKGAYPDGFENKPFYRLPDGTMFLSVYISSVECTGKVSGYDDSCGDMTVDINGYKGPNIVGIDQFNFRILKDRISPTGEPKDAARPPDTHCNPYNEKTYNGYACAGWIIENGNMPWLRGEVPKYPENDS